MSCLGHSGAGVREVEGRDGGHVLIAPPSIIEDGQIEDLIDKLSRARATVFAHRACV
jgi:hypothetical protein